MPDTRSLSHFLENPSEIVAQLKQTGEPVVLTIDGQAELVIQEVAAYRKLHQIAEEARVLEGIHQGLEDMAAGRILTLEEGKAHAHVRRGIKG